MIRGIDGLRPWLIQRISAVYMALFSLYVLTHLFITAPLSATAWRSWLATAPVTVLFALFFTAVLLHAWVGVRDAVLDYIHHTGVRLLVLALLMFGLLANAFWLYYLLFSNATKLTGSV